MKIFVITCFIFCSFYFTVSAQEKGSERILMCIPPSEFSKKEVKISTGIFEKNNYVVDVMSPQKGKCNKKIDVNKYKAIVFIGGVGVKKCYSDTLIRHIIHEGQKNELIIAAIAEAPNILADAGILTNINVTGADIRFLEDLGGTYIGSPVEISDKIVTAKSTKSGTEFALTIEERL